MMVAAFSLVVHPALAWSFGTLSGLDRDAFRSTVVGNAYVDADGAWFQFNGNGTLTGGAQGLDSGLDA